jgi:diacylglycerol kinase family enzyme
VSPGADVRALVGDAETVVVAGGDGTTGLVLRALAGSRCRVGLLPVGTFNNFARALGIPGDLDEAIEVVRTGRPRPVTLGRAGGRPFLEIAAVGLLGELIAVGEAAKELAFGEVAGLLRELTATGPFAYRLEGDLEEAGTARSLVFANTPTTGARLPIGGATPNDPDLELTLGPATGPGRRFRRLVVHTDPPVPVYADTAQVGRTPVAVEALPDAVTVIEPA